MAEPSQPQTVETKAAAAPVQSSPPAASTKDSPDKPTRRGFFKWLTGGWVAFTTGVGMMKILTVRFLYPNVLFVPPSSFKAGYPAEYQIGQVDQRFKEKFGVWIVRNEEGFYALSTTCTHLGCQPNWLEAEQKFKCPCHGSGFYVTGINFEGPAPRPLERYRIMLADDGQILVDKSKKYQFELGQWKDAEALLRV